MSVRALASLSIVGALASVASAQVTNGGFEEPNTGFRTVSSGQTFGGWTNLGPGNIEFVQAVPNGNLPGLQFSAYEGQYWIDLVGTQQPSAISQSLTTLEPGSFYRINWAQAGNVWGGNFAFTMQVLWNGIVVAENTQTHGGSNGQFMNWVERSVIVQANLENDLNVLTFRAITGTTARGPALDAVTITLVPAPGAAAMLGLGTLLVARRRR